VGGNKTTPLGAIVLESRTSCRKVAAGINEEFAVSRYYMIQIDGGPTFTSFPNGMNDPGALQIEMDIPVAPLASPAFSGAAVKIYGIPRAMIGQANNLRFKNIKVYGGFKAGLPLANPAQSGLLVQGYIFQAFGNWVGVEQSLVLVVLAGSAPANTSAPATPPNLAFNWPKNTPMSGAIKNTLSAAFPNMASNINISPNLTLLADEQHLAANQEEFGRYIMRTSKGIIKSPTYSGVQIAIKGTTFNVYDNLTTPSSSSSSSASTAGSTQSASPPKTILFQDLIGQPTWLESPYIQFKTAMRADINIGDMVTLPQTQTVNTIGSSSSIVNQAVEFQGTFQVSSIRHVGNFRQAQADAWVTVIDAFSENVVALATPGVTP
jgi:hypothetical protein